MKAPSKDSPSSRGGFLAVAFGTTSVVSTVLLVALVVLITRQDLWPRLMAGPDDLPEVPTATPDASVQSAVPTLPAGSGSPLVHRTAVNVGEVASSGTWKFVVDSVKLLPDDTASGWSQAIITCTIQNAGAVTASLPIPSTVAAETAVARSTRPLPSFFPAPAAADQAPAAIRGLRLYLVDQSSRQFGGGFGPSGATYQVIAAAGDPARLTYRFRYPSTARAPFVLRMMFPASAGGGMFDVHLDQTDAHPAGLHVANNQPRVTVGDRALADDWAVECEGIDFGPATSPGERPVTIHLRVQNLADQDRPALTVPSDPQGTLRDFYVVDSDGRLAYSHMDDLPGVVVPAGSEREVAVQLYTLDLPSNVRPLFFAAVLNWQANQVAQFRLD